MKKKISGYLLLRIPKYSFDSLGRGAFASYASKIGDLYYGGVDRLQWFDIDEDHYNGTLPKDMEAIRKKLRQTASPDFDLKLCDSFEDAKKMLEYSNRGEKKNELVAISFEDYSESYHLFDADIDGLCLGCDIYYEGYGSIIKQGIFVKPRLFGRYSDQLNTNGLIDCDKEDVIDAYVQAYSQASEAGEVERVDGDKRLIKLYRLDV